MIVGAFLPLEDFRSVFPGSSFPNYYSDSPLLSSLYRLQLPVLNDSVRAELSAFWFCRSNSFRALVLHLILGVVGDVVYLGLLPLSLGMTLYRVFPNEISNSSNRPSFMASVFRPLWSSLVASIFLASLVFSRGLHISASPVFLVASVFRPPWFSPVASLFRPLESSCVSTSLVWPPYFGLGLIELFRPLESSCVSTSLVWPPYFGSSSPVASIFRPLQLGLFFWLLHFGLFNLPSLVASVFRPLQFAFVASLFWSSRSLCRS